MSLGVWRIPGSSCIYLVLLPALVIAACVLGYYTFLTARQFERLGEQSIAESSLLLLQDKVERIEQQIITADNQAFGAIDLDDESFGAGWKLHAEEISPSIRALLVLDADRHIVGYAARATADDQRVLPAPVHDAHAAGPRARRPRAEPADAPAPQLRRAQLPDLVQGGRCTTAGATTFVAHHDTGYLVRSVFADVLRNEPASRRRT